MKRKKCLKSAAVIVIIAALLLGTFACPLTLEVYAGKKQDEKKPNPVDEGPSLELVLTGQWDDVSDTMGTVTARPDKTQEGRSYFIETSADGSSWTVFGSVIKKDKEHAPSWDVSLPDSAGADTKIRISSADDALSKKIKEGKPLTEADMKNMLVSKEIILGEAFCNLLENEKGGFTGWLADGYVRYFGGTAPETVSDIFTAFSIYRSIPALSVTGAAQGKAYYVNAAFDDAGTYPVEWQYMDEAGEWQMLTDTNALCAEVSGCSALLDGGAFVRAVSDIGNGVIVESNSVFANPLQEQYDNAVKQINEGLGLAESTVYWRMRNSAPNTMKVDLSIGGDRFKNNFYYDNIAQDLPVTGAASYANYLAKIYLDADSADEGLAEVKKVWDRYLYDIYDPSYDAKTLNHYTEGVYPNNTYGDKIGYIDWPKDEASSFNTPSDLAPEIRDLDYDYLRRGADYSKAVDGDTGIKKTVTAAAAGDANAERKYTVEVDTSVDMEEKAPVAMILQVQSSWQMFDLDHANVVMTDTDAYDLIEVGAAAYNTELANLYAVKKALLRLADYMEDNYKGNNLLLGVTETQHGHSSSLFYQGSGTADPKKPKDQKKPGAGNVGSAQDMYVTNDHDAIVRGLQFWNSFGNCEHVHYDSDCLEYAVKALKSNLEGWTDSENYELDYDDVRKVAVIIGASTENTTAENGYGITLPWQTFREAELNGVYAIRTNEGTPVAENEQGCISWLEYEGGGAVKKGDKAGEGNVGAGKVPFKDGEGTTYTQEYIATTSDAVFNALVEIADREMAAQGVGKNNSSVYVENLTVTDIVEDEFKLDKTAQITAFIADPEGSTISSRVVSPKDADLTITENADGTTTVSYNFGNVYSGCTAKISFGIEAKEDYAGSNNVFSNDGCPRAEYQHSVVDENGALTGVIEHYAAVGTDTPEVNVPVRIKAEDGSSAEISLGESIDLASLDSEIIVAKAHKIVTNYDQTNGTLSYVWEMPDGSAEKLPVCVHITNGVPDAALPGAAEFSRFFTPDNSADSYTASLRVYFTPDGVTENGNFADSVTAVPVLAGTDKGDVNVKVKAVADCTVYYLEAGSEKQLIEPKVIPGNIIGTTVPTRYEEIENYDLVGPEEIPVFITEDSAQNKAVYYYERAKGTVIIQCFDSTTSRQIGGDVVVATVPVGTAYSVDAPDLSVLKYTLSDQTPKNIVVVRGNNYVKFVYRRIK